MPNPESEQKILDRMKATPTFTYMDLWTPFGPTAPEYRLADRLIQRERRAGNIVQTEKRGVWKHKDQQ